MGLVIQSARADSLFAPRATEKPTKATSGEAKQGDVFAALLASLAGDPPEDNKPSGASDLLASHIAEGEAKAADARGDAPAVMAAMQLLAQLNPVLPGPVSGGQDNLEVTVGSASQLAAQVGAGLPGDDTEAVVPMPVAEAASPSTATEASPALGSAVTNAADGLPAESAPVVPSLPPTQQPAAAAPTVTALVAAIETAVHIAGAKSHTKPNAPEPEDNAAPAPPALLATSSDSTISVVRTAGNAGTNGQQDGKPNGNSGGDKENPTPNASLQGITHAAANSAVGQLRTAAATVANAIDTTSAAPAEAPLPEAVAHVGRTIIEKVEQGGGEARLTLRPEALGEVVLHIRTDGNRVHVAIQAERSEAASLLRDHTRDLSQLLGDRGLTLADVTVGLGGQGSSNQQNELPAWAQPQRQADNSFASLLGIEEPGATDRANRLRSAYNPDGAMSYRV